MRIETRHVRTEHCVQVLNWALSHLFMFTLKLRFVFVRSVAGGCEGELDSSMLSVRRGSLRMHRTWCTSTQFSFSALVFECFKLF